MADVPLSDLIPVIRRMSFGWLWLWGPVAVQMAAIFAASSIPDLKELPGGAPDWLGHGAGYALLSALLLRALAHARLAGVTGRRAVWSALLATAYGLTDEFHQAFVPGRTASLADVAANAAGASLAAGLVWACGIIVAARSRHVP